MYIDDGSVVVITATSFTSNSANSNENSGGAIWMHSGSATLKGCSFSGNSPNDLTRNGGSIVVTNCVPGYYGVIGAALQTYGDSISGSLFSHSCSACGAGKTSSADGDSCQNCLKGTYSDAAGSPTCTDCPVNTFGPSSGASSCQGCPTGRYSGALGATSDAR